jgi:hypothetical protein
MRGERLDQYIPQRDWFLRQEERHYAGIHGIGHIARVLVWVAHLSELTRMELRSEELFWAAGLHDIRRLDDGKDAEHGMRAATWVHEVFPLVRPDIAGSLDVALVASLCRDHATSDEHIASWTPELTVLKDADGLERVRIHDLDARRLRLPQSAGLEQLAWELMRRSVQQGNTADAVRRVAREMNLWR